MVTLTCGSTASALSLLGKSMGKAWGVAEVMVSMKNINNKKTMSVMEDILKLTFSLCRVCSCMGKLLREVARGLLGKLPKNS